MPLQGRKGWQNSGFLTASGQKHTSLMHSLVVKADNVSHKTQRFWLEVAASLAPIVDKVDAGEFKEVDIIRGIKSALLLLGERFTAASFAATENHAPTLESPAKIFCSGC